MLLSASVYASATELAENAIALEQLGIDFFHVDCKSKKEVFADIDKIRSVSNVPIDLHLIATTPQSFFHLIAEHRVEQVAFQWEDIAEKESFLENCKEVFGSKVSFRPKIGLAISTSTPIPEASVLTLFDFVLLMCTIPGESGGVFDKHNLARIIQLKHEHTSLKIHVDGGVNNEIAFVLRLLAVDLIVSGSYLMNHELLASRMLNLMRTPESIDTANHILVKEFMIPKQYMPVLKYQNIDFKKVLQTIELFKLGFVLIEHEQLQGVITNADIRRGLIRKMDTLNDISTDDLINLSPITINEDASLNDLLKLIRHLNFIILFLPVVDDTKQLKGTVLLNNLLRG